MEQRRTLSGTAKRKKKKQEKMYLLLTFIEAAMLPEQCALPSLLYLADPSLSYRSASRKLYLFILNIINE